jgi:hypothetical protein
MPLTVEEQRDPRYVADISCPHCFGGKKPAAGPEPLGIG